MDIKNITSVITAFRTETEANSISPETVGALLQGLAELIGKAPTTADLNTASGRLTNRLDMFTDEQQPQPIETWRDTIAAWLKRLEKTATSAENLSETIASEDVPELRSLIAAITARLNSAVVNGKRYSNIEAALNGIESEAAANGTAITGVKSWITTVEKSTDDNATAIAAIEAALAARKWVKVFDTTTMSGVGINLYDIERNGYRRVRVVALGNQNIAGYTDNDRNEMAAFTVELDALLTAARAKDAEGKPLMLINESTTSAGAKRENAQFGVPVPIEPTNPSKNCNVLFTLSTAAGMTFDDDDSPIGLYVTVQKSYASATPAMWAAYVQRCD